MCFVLCPEVYHFLKDKVSTIYTVSLLVLITSYLGTNTLFMPIKHSPTPHPLFNEINFPVMYNLNF